MSESIIVLHRPVLVDETAVLDSEFRAARWVYNRLLDFELEHQAMLDAISPRLARVGRILARLKRRDRRRERATKGQWLPPEKPELRARLESLREQLRKERNADPRWKEALRWPNEKVEPRSTRRKRGESDEDFEKRRAKNGRSRRDVHALKVYAERRCYWGTYNAQKASVEQALKMVLKERKIGHSAQLRRPMWNDPGRIAAANTNGAIGFEVLERNGIWWTMRLRLHEGWCSFRAKIGNHHELPDEHSIREVELCRHRDGNRWAYTVSIGVRADWGRRTGPGTIGIDTGHRVAEDGALRAFTWYGSDGMCGEVRLPRECLSNTEAMRRVQENIDESFNRLSVPFRNRHSYRKWLMFLGVRTEEQQAWLSWEMQQERRLMRLRKRNRNLRNEAYVKAVRVLSMHYSAMGIDVVGRDVQRLQTEEMSKRKLRRHRDLVAAYELKTICERFGIRDLGVTARKSTAECPGCGNERETGPALEIWCPSCDLTCDQDYGAAYVMMCRAVAARDLDGNHAESHAA